MAMSLSVCCFFLVGFIVLAYLCLLCVTLMSFACVAFEFAVLSDVALCVFKKKRCCCVCVVVVFLYACVLCCFPCLNVCLLMFV